MLVPPTRLARWGCVTLVLLAISQARAGTPPYLVKDINAARRPAGSAGGFVPLGGMLYFGASRPDTGSELWRSDGTEAGTIRLTDVNPGPADSAPAELVVAHGALFFTAQGPAGGRALWRTDGTPAGTVWVADVRPAPWGSTPWWLPRIERPTFFWSVSTEGTRELWKTDGTAAGTVLITGLPDDARGWGPQLTPSGQRAFFAVWTSSSVRDLWTTDGTAAGTVRLTDFDAVPHAASVGEVMDLNGRVLFTVYTPAIFPDRARLWTSDGTVAGTVPVADVPIGWETGLEFTRVNDLLYFTECDHDTEGCHLWRTDGTAEGTFDLARIVSTGYDDHDPPTLTVANGNAPTGAGGTLFFWTSDVAGNQELWKTDGTHEGTARVAGRPFAPEPEGLYGLQDWNGRSLGVNGVLYFQDCDEAGCELWRSDGTETGTERLVDAYPGPASSGAVPRASVGDTVYFTAYEPDAGTMLWRTDGTPTGTTRVASLERSDVTLSSNPSRLTNVDGTLYFAAETWSCGIEAWRSDGTEAGTIQLADIAPGPAWSSVYGFTDVDGTVFFGVIWYDEHERDSRELWKSDGTAPGTTRVAAHVQPEELLGVGGTLFFTSNGYLWRSDGTASGTVRVSEALPYASMYRLTNLNGTLFFLRWDGQGGKLWRSDGTAEGTVRVAEVPTPAGALTVFDGALVFAASDPTAGYELWKSDGSADGTLLVADVSPGPTGSVPHDFAASRGALYFLANERELWKTDGTPGGTERVATANGSCTSLVDVDGLLLFRCVSPGSEGFDLWRSDGTPAGSARVTSVPRGDHYAVWVKAGREVFFLVFRPRELWPTDYWREDWRREEVWRSDGTAEGTGPAVGMLDLPVEVGDQVFFTASESTTGVELWAVGGSAGAGACGNGILDPGEECDDGNRRSGDCCARDCRLERTGSACEDSDPCTGPGSCLDGGCTSGAPLSCNDGNQCTTDACDPVKGCVHTPYTGPCNDYDPCTTDETCASGICQGGYGSSCPGDQNPCTADFCHWAYGCIHWPLDDQCDDRDSCTADLCDESRGCIHTRDPDCTPTASTTSSSTTSSSSSSSSSSTSSSNTSSTVAVPPSTTSSTPVLAASSTTTSTTRPLSPTTTTTLASARPCPGAGLDRVRCLLIMVDERFGCAAGASSRGARELSAARQLVDAAMMGSDERAKSLLRHAMRHVGRVRRIAGRGIARGADSLCLAELDALLVDARRAAVAWIDAAPK